MDFELTEEQSMLQKSIAKFAKKEFTRERSIEYDRKHEFPWDLYRKLCSQGYVGVNWPEEYGGQGLGIAEKMIIAYEMVKAEPNLGSTMCAGNFGADIIHYNGSNEQKKKWLPMLARGEITSAGCFTEPNGGSDLTRVLDTRAVRQDSDWIINGSKCFITNATTASIFITLTQTDPEAKPPHRGQTDFIVERESGIETRVQQGKMGWFSIPTGEVVFNDVRVPEDSIVGGPENENRGIYMAMGFLDEGRLYVGIKATALAEAALQRSIQYAMERHAFGRPLAGFQALAHRIVEMATKVESMKALCDKGIWIRDRARKDPALMNESMRINSMVKWQGARTAVESCDLAVDVFGGSGYFSEEDVTRWYTLAKQMELVEGTKEIQKNLIARVTFGNEIVKMF